MSRNSHLGRDRVHRIGRDRLQPRGDCWHVREHEWVGPEHGLIVHPDDWKWREHENYRWREHEGRGYWRGGRWIEIH